MNSIDLSDARVGKTERREEEAARRWREFVLNDEAVEPLACSSDGQQVSESEVFEHDAQEIPRRLR
jgi:hypothetical protein